MTTSMFTVRLGFGSTICDPIANRIHTGSWSKWRHGTRGRFPKKMEFHTDCGKSLQAISHECNHEFVECEECRKAVGKTSRE